MALSRSTEHVVAGALPVGGAGSEEKRMEHRASLIVYTCPLASHGMQAAGRGLGGTSGRAGAPAVTGSGRSDESPQ